MKLNKYLDHLSMYRYLELLVKIKKTIKSLKAYISLRFYFWRYIMTRLIHKKLYIVVRQENSIELHT